MGGYRPQLVDTSSLSNLPAMSLRPSLWSTVFVVAGERGISAKVKGTGEAGGEDKERSGTGAALTTKRRALDGKRPST